jgi:Sec-independent protein secretion pathway component TatC
MMAGPLIVLYEIGIIVSRIAQKKKEGREAVKAEADEADEG